MTAPIKQAIAPRDITSIGMACLYRPESRYRRDDVNVAILEWIKLAKRPETRAKQISETARLANEIIAPIKRASETLVVRTEALFIRASLRIH